MPPLTVFLLLLACSQCGGRQRIYYYIQLRCAPPKLLHEQCNPGRQVQLLGSSCLLQAQGKRHVLSRTFRVRYLLLASWHRNQHSAISRGPQHDRRLAHQKHDERYSGGNVDSYTLPTRHCPNGFLMHIIFPSCWNGKNVTSPNFQDHVSYPVGTYDGGTCPTTHPIRLITMRMEQVIHSQNFEYYDEAFVLSTGDNVGYSSHGDFANGWDASDDSISNEQSTFARTRRIV